MFVYSEAAPEICGVMDVRTFSMLLGTYTRVASYFHIAHSITKQAWRGFTLQPTKCLPESEAPNLKTVDATTWRLVMTFAHLKGGADKRIWSNSRKMVSKKKLKISKGNLPQERFIHTRGENWWEDRSNSLNYRTINKQHKRNSVQCCTTAEHLVVEALLLCRLFHCAYSRIDKTFALSLKAASLADQQSFTILTYINGISSAFKFSLKWHQCIGSTFPSISRVLTLEWLHIGLGK
jgi:hypothetical protein